jgi:hypothetical protein
VLLEKTLNGVCVALKMAKKRLDTAELRAKIADEQNRGGNNETLREIHRFDSGLFRDYKEYSSAAGAKGIKNKLVKPFDSPTR